MSLDPALGIWRTCDGCGRRFWCEDGGWLCLECDAAGWQPEDEPDEDDGEEDERGR